MRAALGADAHARLGVTSAGLATLAQLCDTHAALWALEDQARSGRASAEQIAEVKRGIDRLNGARHGLIDRFDGELIASLAPRAAGGAGAAAMVYSETPGELGDRLIILTLKITHARATADDPSIAADVREACAQRLVGLTAWKAHLEGCLGALLEDLLAGRARCPPRAEFKMYNDPRFNPVLRAEKAP